MLYPRYVSVDDLKRHLRIPGNYEGTINTEEDTTDDIQLELAIDAASRVIDNICNRQFGLSENTETLTYTAWYDKSSCVYRVNTFDFMTVSGLVVKVDTGSGDYETVATYTPTPYDAAIKNKPWTEIVFDRGTHVPTYLAGVTVEAKYGWTEIPAPIKQATLLQAARIYKRRDAAFGVAGSPAEDSGLRLLAKIDPDVYVIIQRYVRNWGAM